MSKVKQLRVSTQIGLVGVDHESKIIRGMVVAQKGIFKSGRGQFNDECLKIIVNLINLEEKGVKSRFGHPNEPYEDGLGKYLGRVKNARLDVDKVRADLYLDPSSSKTPYGDLAGYVLDIASNDASAISSSLVLLVDYRLPIDESGNILRDENGEILPPIWYPKKIFASDIVETGDAVDSLLSYYNTVQDSTKKLWNKLLNLRLKFFNKN